MRRAAGGRQGGQLLLAAGAFTLVNNYIPGSGHLDVPVLNLVAGLALLLGAVCLVVPWERLPLRAQLVVVLAAGAAGAAALTLTDVDRGWGWGSPSTELRWYVDGLGSPSTRLQLVGNVVLLAPATCAAVLLWPQTARPDVLVRAGVAAGTGTELLQWWLPLGRVVSPLDSVLDAAGVVLAVVGCCRWRSGMRAAPPVGWDGPNRP